MKQLTPDSDEQLGVLGGISIKNVSIWAYFIRTTWQLQMSQNISIFRK